jgi:hypothetical protein
LLHCRACHTCGKVLGEVSVPKKNKQYGTIGLDSSSSNSGIYESKILTYAFDQANDDNHPIQGYVHLLIISVFSYKYY